MRKRLRKGLDWKLSEEERKELKKPRVVDRDDDDLMGLVFVKGDRGKKRKLLGGEEESEGEEGEEEESEGDESEEG